MMFLNNKCKSCRYFEYHTDNLTSCDNIDCYNNSEFRLVNYNEVKLSKLKGVIEE
jgi:hypothetical protein